MPDTRTGVPEATKALLSTAVDNHSKFCVHGFRELAARRSRSLERHLSLGSRISKTISSELPVSASSRFRRRKAGARCAPQVLNRGSPGHDQIPAPSSNDSLRALAWDMLLSRGTSRVSHTLPPIDEPLPIVTRPRIVAPA